MRFAVDTNILAYAERLNDETRELQAHRLIEGLNRRLVVPAQALGELYRVLRRKARRDAQYAAQQIIYWSSLLEVVGTSADAFKAALSLSARHSHDIWDSVMLAVAAEAECAVLLTEDLQDGFVWDGVTVVNPFARVLHPLLASTLGIDRL